MKRIDFEKLSLFFFLCVYMCIYLLEIFATRQLEGETKIGVGRRGVCLGV